MRNVKKYTYHYNVCVVVLWDPPLAVFGRLDSYEYTTVTSPSVYTTTSTKYRDSRYGTTPPRYTPPYTTG